MPKTKAQKQEMVEVLTKQVKASKSMLVISPKAVNPNEATELKIKLAEIGGEYHVVKNNLFKRALEAAELEVPVSINTGQNAVVFVGEQAPEAAKIIKEFIKATEKAEFKQGYLDMSLISAEEVSALADLPSREQLLAQVVGTMNAPISGFVNVLAGNIRGVVTVIDAIKAQKEEN